MACDKELKHGPWQSYMLCALIPHRLMVSRGPNRTLYGLLRAMVASFNCMSIRGGGSMPSEPFPGCGWGHIDKAEAGKKVAGQWFFEYSGLKGDLEFKRDVNGWIDTGRYYACMCHCCAHCFASAIIPELPYDDFRKDAAHKKTIISTDHVLANTEVSQQSPLMTLYGWLHELDCPDLLHNVNQGSGQGLCGSALVILGEAHFYDDKFKAIEHQWECCRLELQSFCGALKVSHILHVCLLLQNTSSGLLLFFCGALKVHMFCMCACVFKTPRFW